MSPSAASPCCSHRSQALRKVGAIFEAPAFYDYLSGWENLRILMGYSGGFDASRRTRNRRARRSHETHPLQGPHLQPRHAPAPRARPVPAAGTARSCCSTSPPTASIPEGIKWFRDFILELRDERGMTVLFNSHLLAEVELMCDRVAILREGQRVFEGSVGGLHEDTPVFEVDLEPWDTALPPSSPLTAREILAPGRIALPPDADPAGLVAALVGAGIRVRAFAPVRRSLEDLYLEITAAR